MGSLIFLIVVIFMIASAVKGSKGQEKQKAEQDQKRAEMIRRQNASRVQPNVPKKPSGQYKNTVSAPMQKNVQKNTQKKKPAAQQEKSTAEKYPTATRLAEAQENRSVQESRSIQENRNIIEAAKKNAVETERENDKDARENLLDDVYAAIVMGPKDSMTFQRDFLAEGMDMLNIVQSEHRT